MRSVPGFCALSNQVLLVLLGLSAMVPWGFGMGVVVFVVNDLGQSGCSMLVDLTMITIEGGLPVGLVVVLQTGGSLPSCEGCIPQVHLLARLASWSVC